MATRRSILNSAPISSGENATPLLAWSSASILLSSPAPGLALFSLRLRVFFLGFDLGFAFGVKRDRDSYPCWRRAPIGETRTALPLDGSGVAAAT